ncbi:energy-coupling factor transporter transmembrane component T [Brucella pseudogrignonensis]|uniref:energy-coupling factor transporter transmembrane component T family protein n=1 Tax=Brucella pseudogrignonensis TaxID=419475 RepID=UPI0028BAC18B|nr:energy-coupling factor transporter transmembrane component T [Brucella pseudogrignonensis]MDT6941316.1 energy-coupling factor transporter transmembrane component T [Brucella pseudogrignonensis]
MIRSLYIDGEGLLYKTPIKLKLLLLFSIGIILYVTNNFPLLISICIFCGIIYFSIRQSLVPALKRLLPIFITILIVSLFSFFLRDKEEAVFQLLRLTSLMLFAAAITATTKIGEFIQAITDFSKPLERIGIANAEDIGLAIGLILRFVPEILTRYEAIRDAHKVRGLKLRLLTILPSLIILTLQQADQIAQAIDARNLRSR